MGVRERIHYAGFDPGTGFGSIIIAPTIVENGKIVEREQALKLTIPSLIGGAKFTKFVNDRATQTSATLKDVMKNGEIALEYNLTQYFIGPLAESEGINTTAAKGAKKRYTDLHSRLLFLGMYGALTSEKTSIVRLVTGVPMSLHDKPMRDAVKANLQGEHPYSWNGQERTVTVTVGSVTREGIKALALYGSPTARQGMVDIGERTTDIGQADGQKPINTLCNAETYGVGKVLDTLRYEIRARYKRSLPMSVLRALLKADTDGRPLPVVKVGNTPIPPEEITSIIWKAKASEWNAIDTFIDSTWNEEGTEIGSNLEQVLCIGGGAKVWQKELKAKFSQAIFPQASEMFPDAGDETGLIANAEAYLTLALDLEDIDENIWNG